MLCLKNKVYDFLFYVLANTKPFEQRRIFSTVRYFCTIPNISPPRTPHTRLMSPMFRFVSFLPRSHSSRYAGFGLVISENNIKDFSDDKP